MASDSIPILDGPTPAISQSKAAGIIIPDGFTLHTENNSHILLSSNEAFLNPIQEFNRDTSIACIQVWSEELDKKKKEKWLKSQERKLEKKEPLAKRPKREQNVFKDFFPNQFLPQLIPKFLWRF